MNPELIEEEFGYDFDDSEDYLFEEDDDDDYVGMDDDDDFDSELFEFDSEDDEDDTERRRRSKRRRRRGRSRGRSRSRSRGRRPRTARGRGYFERQLKGFVKREELRSSLKKVGMDVRRNGSAIKKNASQISSNRSGVSSAMRENRRQSKDLTKVRNDMQQAQQMNMLMSFLDGGPKKYKVISENGEGNSRVLTLDEQGDTLMKLLPLFMSSSSGSSGGMDMSNPLMLLMLSGGLK